MAASGKPRAPMSAAARAHISAALKGKAHPHRGVPKSAGTRAKLSASLKGKTRTPEQKKHIAMLLAARGHPRLGKMVS